MTGFQEISEELGKIEFRKQKTFHRFEYDEEKTKEKVDLQLTVMK